MSINADQTLFIYYAEQRLDFNDGDVARLFLIIGLLGVLVQSFVLNRGVYWLGERLVVILAFVFGALQNSVYAFALDKRAIFVARAMGSIGGMLFPTISAIKANNVVSLFL